jgi:hypothetical protein
MKDRTRPDDEGARSADAVAEGTCKTVLVEEPVRLSLSGTSEDQDPTHMRA